jgi:hypothetical protein
MIYSCNMSLKWYIALHQGRVFQIIGLFIQKNIWLPELFTYGNFV